MPSILLVAASRGLGLAMAAEFLNRGWNVVGTVRAGAMRTGLHELAGQHAGRLEIQTLDVCEQGQVAALRERLSKRRFEMLFVNAGVVTRDTATLGEAPTGEFVRVMTTNALAPMRVIESLQHLVTAEGLIGVMSSGQGSLANNLTGMREIYRSSKSALNQFMRSYAARDPQSRRPLVLIAPGWVRTDLGGPTAPLGLEDSVPKVVDVLLAKQGRAGLEYLDYQGQTVPW